MKIRYLGTAAAEGFPAIFCECEACRRAARLGGKDIRTRSSLLVDDCLLVDLGPDLYLQKLRDKLELGKLKAVLFTHSHADHLDLTGLAMRDTEAYCHTGREEPLHVYGNSRVLERIRSGMQFEFGTAEIPSVKAHLVHAGDRILQAPLTACALPATHDPREECLLYLLMDDADAVLVANDTGAVAPEFFRMLKEGLQGRKLTKVSVDCNFGTEDHGPCGHMSIVQNRQFRAQLLENGAANQNTRYWVTHFSHNCGLDHAALCAKFEAEGFSVAYDGLEI